MSNVLVDCEQKTFHITYVRSLTLPFYLPFCHRNIHFGRHYINYIKNPHYLTKGKILNPV